MSSPYERVTTFAVRVGSAAHFRLKRVHRTDTDAEINGSNGIVYRVQDERTATDISGAGVPTWPVTVPYESGSAGDYSLVIPAEVTVQMTADRYYYALVDMQMGGDLKRLTKIRMKAVEDFAD